MKTEKSVRTFWVSVEGKGQFPSSSFKVFFSVLAMTRYSAKGGLAGPVFIMVVWDSTEVVPNCFHRWGVAQSNIKVDF